MRTLSLLLLALVAQTLAPVAPVSAQDAADTGPIAVGNLINPRGFVFDPSGQLVIAEAGTGGDQAASEAVPGPTGPFTGGLTGQVVVGRDGCPTILASGLASARGAGGDVIGPAAIAIVGEATFVLVTGGGASHGNPDQPAGIYDISTGTPRLVADLSAWIRANPVANPPADDFDPDGSWYAMVADPTGAFLWVVESNSEQILRVTLDGQISRAADLSAENQVPTAIVVAPDGAAYFGNFSPTPFAPGTASVSKINSDGTTEQVWTGLTMVTGLALDAQGTLYAAEMSDGRDEPPYFVPGTGRIVRQTGPAAHGDVVTMLNLPTAIAFGPDDALYVSTPANGADGGNGLILRFDLTQSLPLTLDAADLTPPACGAAAATTEIKLSDLGFDPASITIQAGATVTWRNTGEFDHSVQSAPDSPLQFDSGPLRPGEEFTQTFDQPGSYPYFDGLFPDNVGAIEVIAGP